MMIELKNIAENSGAEVTFISGHEHGMQYFDRGLIQYVISGGGSKDDYVQRGGNVDYARGARGFAKVCFHTNDEAWLEMYTVSGFGQKPILEFRKQIRD